MSPPILLCYNIKEKRAHRIQVLAAKYGIQIRHVKKEEYNQTLTALMNKEEAIASSYDDEAFEREMLVMANFPSAKLNGFLNAFHLMKIPPVRLKCILTEQNSKWSSIQLYHELLQEETYFNALRLETQKRKGTAHTQETPKTEE